MAEKNQFNEFGDFGWRAITSATAASSFIKVSWFDSDHSCQKKIRFHFRVFFPTSCEGCATNSPIDSIKIGAKQWVSQLGGFDWSYHHCHFSINIWPKSCLTLKLIQQKKDEHRTKYIINCQNDHENRTEHINVYHVWSYVNSLYH